MDLFSPQKRREIMSRIKSADTSPERAVRSALHKIGFRFRKNDSRYDGKPDAVFPRFNAALFVNGCFWHGHEGCKKFRLPEANQAYWRQKIEKNKARDEKNVKALLSAGWRVGIVWECSISGRGRRAKLRAVSDEILLWLEEGGAFAEF